MSLTSYLLLTIVLTGAELLYIRVARSLSWFDVPNARSAHKNATTVRGGGFVFYLAVVGARWPGMFNFFGLGLTAIAVISFWDDISGVAGRYRLAVHALAVGALWMQGGVGAEPWYLYVSFLILGVGIVNAYNFMDGINGMTALYSLVTIGTLWYWQVPTPGDASSLFPCVLIALLIFSFMNVRQRAICFAGDVGSVSMGFIVLYGVLMCIRQTHTYLPVLFLSVYGVDTIATIFYRLRLRQDIFRAHRLHLFQRLVHELGWPHLRVSALYALAQASINVLVVVAMGWSIISQLWLAGLVLGGLLVGWGIGERSVRLTQKRVGFEKPTPHEIT